MAEKEALVTGALGHAGSFMVDLLVKEGWKVVATDLPATQRKMLMTKEKIYLNDVYNKSLGEKDVTFIGADLTDKESLKSLFENQEYDVIFHTASLYDYFASYDLLEKVNVGGLKNFLEVYWEFNKNAKEMPRLLHWSTCGVYGQPKYERWDIPADETAPFNPPNDYSRSKVGQEKLLREWKAEKNIPISILRSAPIYGPYQSYGIFLILFMLRKAGLCPIAHVYPRKKRLRMPLIHVEDLVGAALCIAEAPKDKVVGEAFNIIADCGYQDNFEEYISKLLHVDYASIPIPWFLFKFLFRTSFRLAGALTKYLKKKGIRGKIDPPMADYTIHQYFFSNKKLKDLGFEFKYPDMYSGLKMTIDWYEEHGWLDKEEWELEENMEFGIGSGESVDKDKNPERFKQEVL
ncbi:MAG: NAD-dependent epimerase/dehydratase family protein [Candidatus Hodarchaeota archaeon]